MIGLVIVTQAEQSWQILIRVTVETIPLKKPLSGPVNDTLNYHYNQFSLINRLK